MSNTRFQGENFFVEQDGIHSVRYEEGEKYAIVSGERLVGGGFPPSPTYLLFANTLTNWRTPVGDLPITRAERERVIGNICTALTAWNVRFEIEY